ncbi:MAG: radical SAM protein [Betaproteobacteria bacterium]|nr:radical SAM protein [Betaproteobacteria bacterium]
MNVTGKRLEVTDHNRDSAGMTYVYPVLSRRAGGVSIGINLNPNNACNWRCIYCQVPGLRRGSAPRIDLALLERELDSFIEGVQQGDFMAARVPEGARRIADVAFSGNGEPTSAASFPQAIEIVGKVLRAHCLEGGVKIRLITNGSQFGSSRVQEGVRRLGELGGEVWFKVDAGTREGFRRINGADLAPEAVMRNLRRSASLCTTWVQTCLFALDGLPPGDVELAAYLSLLCQAGIGKLAGVHLYGLARPSMQAEAPRLSRLPPERMEEIACRLRNAGLTVHVSP